MKKILLLIAFSMTFYASSFGYNVTIIESQSGGAAMDTVWFNVCVNMGFTPTISPQSTLDNNTFFATTNLLIISSGTIALPGSRVATIQQFLQTGKPVYLQTEYDYTLFTTNQAFQSIITNLGGTFAWGGTTAGTLVPMVELGTFATNNISVAPLSYFWYGCFGTGGCNIMNMLEYQGQHFGFQYCSGTAAVGSLSTTSDQDWIRTSTNDTFMMNILTHLINTNLCNISGSNPTVNLGHDTTLCNGQSFLLNANNSNVTSYLWSTGATTSSINVTTTGAYWVSVTNSCGSARDTVNVTFSPPPVANAGNNATVCAGHPINLNGSGGTSYHWSPSTFLNNPNIATPTCTPTATTTYTVTVSIGNCSATATVTITVLPGPIANFVADTTIGCNLLTVSFTNLTTNFDSLHWYFGDGNQSLLTNPVHSYGPGTYTVILVAYGPNGCVSSISMTAYIVVLSNPLPTSSFTETPISGCVPLNVHFNNTSTSSTSYYWDFGDTFTSTATSPNHTFNSTGTFVVVLISYDSTVCGIQNATSNHVVTVSPSATAAFTADTLNGCTPFTVHFNSTSTLYDSLHWNFGDLSTSNAANPIHVYNGAGTYTVTLIAYGGSGCNDTIIQTSYIHVNASQTTHSAFTASPLSGCAPVTVTFNNSSTNGTSYFWNFGDLSTSNSTSPTHTYNTPGTYSVRLISYNTSICGVVTDTSAPISIVVNAWAVDSFTLTPTTGCTPLNVAFTNLSTHADSIRWNFGDLSTSTTLNPTHTYNNQGTYTVYQIAYGAGGCNDTMYYNSVTVMSAPVTTSSFTPINNMQACDSLTVTFNNGSTNAINYLWNFGDGNTSTQINPTHTYTTSGTYTVKLYSYDTTACGVAVDSSIHANQITINRSAIAAFPDTNLVGCGNISVLFNNSSQFSNSWLWNFGDGNTSSSQFPTHNYSTPGVYYVTLIAYGTGGCNDTLINQDTITVININIYSVFTASTNSGCAPLTVNFTNQSNNGVTYLWNFGDGSTSTSLNPSHIYTDSGTFKVILYVYNDTHSPCGILADSSLTITISVDTPIHPRSIFTANPVKGCSPVIVSLIDSSKDYNFYYWNFGDGTMDSLFSTHYPIHYYNAGNYTVTLITYYLNKCNTAPDSMRINIEVDSCNLTVTNVFTPNGDTKNDLFYFIADGYTNYHLEIFDRWGLKVFESSDTKTLWNGKINNTGADAPDGTYFYIFTSIDYNQQPYATHGYISLIR